MPGSKFQMKLKPGLAFEFEALQDNLGSGQETGRRQHEPITIVREVDEASPLIWQALCTNESYVSATLSFARPDNSGGREIVTHTIELTNGAIVGYRSWHGGRGKKREIVTVAFDDLAINGVRQGIVPHFVYG